jgi:predicted DNA-binding transcriptional regulator AlpA
MSDMSDMSGIPEETFPQTFGKTFEQCSKIRNRMKAELTLPEEFVDAIACKVVELIKPTLSSNCRQKDEDIIFDVKGLSQFLHVDESWVYKQVSLKAIPHFKVGKYTRFRKREISKWLESRQIPSLTHFRPLKKAG